MTRRLVKRSNLEGLTSTGLLFDSMYKADREYVNRISGNDPGAVLVSEPTDPVGHEAKRIYKAVVCGHMVSKAETQYCMSCISSSKRRDDTCPLGARMDNYTKWKW